MNLNFLYTALIALVFSSCTAKHEKREQELLTKIQELEADLDDCQNGPASLFNQLKIEFEQNNHPKVVALYQEIMRKNSGAPELMEAKVFADQSARVIEKEKEAAREKEKAEEAERLSSLNRLKKQHDDISGITWYKQPYFTHYTNSNRASIYMGTREGSSPWLRLQMTYQGEDWIFFERAYLSYEGNTREIEFDKYREKKTDVGGGVSEWIDVSVSEALIGFLREFSSSSDAKMRLSGKYSKTRNLSENERKGIRDVLAGYDVLKANEN